jgi:peptide/nickel transport system ATP-binding protein
VSGAEREPLVCLRGLSVAYRGDTALEGIDLDILVGERLAIIGESGSGKSTLALAIAGLLPETAKVGGGIEWNRPLERSRPLPPPSGLPAISPSRGEIGGSAVGSFSSVPDIDGSGDESVISPLEGEMAGRPEGRATGRRLNGNRPLPGRDIGFVFQDPSASLDPVMSVGRQVAEVARTHLGLNWDAALAHARALFERVRLPDPGAILHAFPHQLSGGQKQRAAIAAAIAAGPRLLIADEATSALDTIVQAEIVALVNELVAAGGMTLIFISHDIALAAAIADRIAVFRAGKLVEIGPARRIISDPEHPYTRALLDAHIGLDTPPILSLAEGADD